MTKERTMPGRPPQAARRDDHKSGRADDRAADSSGSRSRPEQSLEDIDAKLLRQLVGRTRRLAREAQARRAKGQPVASAPQEKALWGVWASHLREAGFSDRLAKQVFIALNALAYDAATGPEAREQAFFLTPASGRLQIAVEAPASSRKAMYVLALASVTGAECAVSPVVAADPLIEFAKAMNQVGGKLSWEGSEFAVRAESALGLDGASPFVGSFEPVFALLLALALTSQANCRFSGGPELKLLDVGPYARLLPMLNARLAPIDRRAPGLPVRLESGDQPPREIALPTDCPEDLAASLLLFGWRFEAGLSMTFAPESAAARGVVEAAPVLAQCGVEVRLEPGRATVRPDTPKVPARPQLPADPVLGSLLLALPRFRAGETTLIGMPDADSPLAASAFKLLEAAGLTIEVKGGRLATRDAPWPESPVFAPDYGGLVPLAAALAAAAPRGARLELPAGRDGDEARQVLTACGKSFTDLGEALDIEPGFGDPQAVHVPDAGYALAVAALSLSKAPQALANPGAASTLWPGFFNIFNRFPTLTDSLFARKEKPDDEPARNRRIKIR